MPKHSFGAVAEGMPNYGRSFVPREGGQPDDDRAQRSASAKAATYDLDDVQGDVGHVSVLLGLALEIHNAVPFDEAAGRVQAERIATLLWVARDVAEAINRSIDSNFAALLPGRRVNP